MGPLSLVPIPLFFPLSLSSLRVLASETSPSCCEQQDTRQETALDISLSYIYKVSQMAASKPHPDLFHRPAPGVTPHLHRLGTTAGTARLPALTPQNTHTLHTTTCTHLPAYLSSAPTW